MFNNVPKIHFCEWDLLNDNPFVLQIHIVNSVIGGYIVGKDSTYTGSTVIYINPLSANPTKWSNTLKQFVGFCRRIVWVCLTILWD